MARILIYPSLDSLEAVEGTCDQQRCCSDCMDAQADLSLCYSHNSHTFYGALPHVSYTIFLLYKFVSKTIVSGALCM